MAISTEDAEGNEGEQLDDLAQLRSEILSTKAGRAAYEDAKRRTAMLASMRAVRGAQGLSQREVAEEMGTTQSAISQIESGKADPQLRTLQRYARAIDLRLDMALVDEGLPSYDEGMANGLWSVVERLALSPLLTGLSINTQENRTVDALAKGCRLPADLVRPILASLQDRGWIAASTHRGVTTYELRSEAALTIGVAIERDAVVGVLLDLRGHEIDREPEHLETRTQTEVTSAVVKVAARLYERRGDRDVVGVGVNVAGVVEIDTGTVVFAPDLAGDGDRWTNVPLEAELQRQLQERVGDPNLLVALENDANSLAMREHLLNGGTSVVAVLMSNGGRGIGVGVVVDGKVVYGEDHAAGEGGHVIVDPDGAECRSGGHRGCLETVATAQGILQRLGLASDDRRSVDEGLVLINHYIEKDDAEAIQAVRDAGAALGSFMATTMILFDPTRVVIYGPRELVNGPETPSAREFQEGLNLGLVGGLAKGENLRDRVSWRVLSDRSAARAAGSAAMHWFLEHPDHWQPSVLSRRNLDALRT